MAPEGSRAPAAGLVWAWVSLAAVFACAGPASWRYQEALDAAPPAATHALHDERLRDLMRDLERLRTERLPQAFDVHGAQQRRIRDLVAAARALSASAARIPSALPEALEAEDRQAFRALAGQLQHLADDLAEQAPALSVPQQRERLFAIDATCSDCHRRFRIPGLGSEAD